MSKRAQVSKWAFENFVLIHCAQLRKTFRVKHFALMWP